MSLLWKALDKVLPVSGSEIIAMLPEAEASCIREGLSEGDLNTFLGAPVREAVIAEPVPGCLSARATFPSSSPSLPHGWAG